MTYQSLTNRWSLTSDEDRSTHKDWLEASGENSLPTSFVVGPEGLIDWIGHPQDLPETLKQVVKGTWDREKALAERTALLKSRFETATVTIAPGDNFPALTVDHWFDDADHHFPAIVGLSLEIFTSSKSGGLGVVRP